MSNKRIEITSADKQLMSDALDALDKEIDKKIEDVRKFKWLCHNHLPQSGDEYVKNINVFEIAQKTVNDLEVEKKTNRERMFKIINHKGQFISNY